jgi:hypothetical protein
MAELSKDLKYSGAQLFDADESPKRSISMTKPSRNYNMSNNSAYRVPQSRNQMVMSQRFEVDIQS